MRELFKNKVFRTIIIYFIICFVLFGFKSCAKANVYIGNNSTVGNNLLSYNAYTTFQSGAKNIYFDNTDSFMPYNQTKSYFKITMCTDGTVSNVRSVTNNFTNAKSNFYLTNVKCNYPGTNYDKGRIIYFYGFSSLCDNNNCLGRGQTLFNMDKQSSWVLLNEEYSTTGFNLDFSTDNSSSYNSTMVDQNQTIIQYQENTYGMISNGHVNGQGIHDKNDQFKNLIPTNGTITNVLLMPISLIGAYMSGVSSTCSSFHLGHLYGHHILLPCINMESFFGTDLWIIIDVLFTGFMIYNMGKKLVTIFNDMTSLKDNQIDELYGGGK